MMDGSHPSAGFGRAVQSSTRTAFFVAGFGVAAWAPLVPFAKSRAGLTDGTLGLLLLCMGVGSIVAMPLAGAMARRVGCRTTMLAASAAMCVALPLLAILGRVSLLAPALLVFGAGVGSIDCVMNIQAVVVERASGRPMMSGFHALFSLGGILGATAVTALLSIEASPFAAALAMVAVVVLALARAAPHLLSGGDAGAGAVFAVPRGIVLLMGILCFIMFLVEGSILDWSAVFLSSERGAGPAYAGLGYAAFALTMTAGRFAGDAIVRRLGGIRVIALGSLCAAFGLGLAVLAPVWWVGVAGYALVGVGCSNIVPVLYTAVGRQTVMPEHLAIPTLTSLGYAGILAGPAAIGAIAHVTSLSTAFLVLMLLLLGVAASSRAVTL